MSLFTKLQWRIQFQPFSRSDHQSRTNTLVTTKKHFQQLRLLVDVEACVALNAFGFQRNCDTSNFGQSSRVPGMWHVPESVPTETMEAAQKVRWGYA